MGRIRAALFSLTLCLTLCAACDTGISVERKLALFQTPAPDLERSSGVAQRRASSSASVPSSALLRVRWSSARSRFDPPPLDVARLTHTACPDSAWQDLSAPARTLVFRAEDARFQPKHLMPSALTAQLTSNELSRVHRYFEGEHTSFLQDPVGQPRSERAARAANAELENLGQRRFLGVFRITQYHPSRLVRKRGERRRHWTPGFISAWLTVHDLEQPGFGCQIQVKAWLHPGDAPVSRRLEAKTEEQLMFDLAALLIDRSKAQLATVSRALRFPEPY